MDKNLFKCVNNNYKLTQKKIINVTNDSNNFDNKNTFNKAIELKHILENYIKQFTFFYDDSIENKENYKIFINKLNKYKNILRDYVNGSNIKDIPIDSLIYNNDNVKWEHIIILSNCFINNKTTQLTKLKSNHILSNTIYNEISHKLTILNTFYDYLIKLNLLYKSNYDQHNVKHDIKYDIKYDKNDIVFINKINKLNEKNINIDTINELNGIVNLLYESVKIFNIKTNDDEINDISKNVNDILKKFNQPYQYDKIYDKIYEKSKKSKHDNIDNIDNVDNVEELITTFNLLIQNIYNELKQINKKINEITQLKIRQKNYIIYLTMLQYPIIDINSYIGESFSKDEIQFYLTIMLNIMKNIDSESDLVEIIFFSQYHYFTLIRLIKFCNFLISSIDNNDNYYETIYIKKCTNSVYESFLLLNHFKIIIESYNEKMQHDVTSYSKINYMSNYISKYMALDTHLSQNKGVMLFSTIGLQNISCIRGLSKLKLRVYELYGKGINCKEYWNGCVYQKIIYYTIDDKMIRAGETDNIQSYIDDNTTYFDVNINILKNLNLNLVKKNSSIIVYDFMLLISSKYTPFIIFDLPKHQDIMYQDIMHQNINNNNNNDVIMETFNELDNKTKLSIMGTKLSNNEECLMNRIILLNRFDILEKINEKIKKKYESKQKSKYDSTHKSMYESIYESIYVNEILVGINKYLYKNILKKSDEEIKNKLCKQQDDVYSSKNIYIYDKPIIGDIIDYYVRNDKMMDGISINPVIKFKIY